MVPPAVLIIFQTFFILSIAVALVLGATWIITNLQFQAQARKLATGGKDEDHPTEPLMLPYAIPWLGNSIGFLTDQAAFWAGMRKTLGPTHALCTTRMGPVKCYIISGAQNIQAMFKLSRHLSSDKLERQILNSVFGLSHKDIDIVQQPARDDGGQVGNMGKRNRRFDIKKLYQEFLLMPHAVNALTGKFLEGFEEVLGAAPEIPALREEEEEEEEEAGEWATVNFYEWLKGHMFTASTTALLGSKVLELNPDLAKDFWVFDENMLKLVYGLPRLLARKGHEARDRLVEGAVGWLEDAKRSGDIDSAEDWDPWFGSRFSREREKMDQKMGLGIRARAGIKIALLFGISSNAIPATGWILLHILTSPHDLLPRILSELQSCETTTPTANRPPSPSPSLPTISLPDLTSPLTTPLLHSIYTETLRHHLALNLSRDVKSACVIDGHLLQPGGLVMAPSWVMHRSNEAWPDPPAEHFCPDRFLLVPDERGKGAKFSTAGTQGKLFPYGGGAHVCPGRVFAKQEILAAVAMVLARFEFEFVGWDRGKEDGGGGGGGLDERRVEEEEGFPGYKKGYVGLGVMAMEWDARVRVRRRRRRRMRRRQSGGSI